MAKKSMRCKWRAIKKIDIKFQQINYTQTMLICSPLPSFGLFQNFPFTNSLFYLQNSPECRFDQSPFKEFTDPFLTYRFF